MRLKRIYIEITNVCNLNCEFCEPHKRTNRFMTFDEFETILNKISNFSSYIYLHVKGEPLLHPEFDKFVKLAYEKGFQINLTTNATLLENHLENTKYLRQINVSFHATNNEKILKTTKKISDCIVNYRIWNFNENNEALELIKNPKMDVYVSATVGEELGLRGAKCVGYNVNPDYSISVDVTFGKSEGSDDKSFELAKGPTICISPSLSIDLTKRLFSIANEKEIPYQTETEGGSTGTNAWAVAKNADNCRCALLSVPIRYMHSTCEVVSFADIENAAKIIAAFIEEGDLNA